MDAVLVDDTTWNGLQRLRTFQGVLRVLYISPPLPTPPVIGFPGVTKDERQRMSRVLCGMRSDPAAKKLIKTLQITGFEPVDGKALNTLAVSYRRTN